MPAIPTVAENSALAKVFGYFESDEKEPPTTLDVVELFKPNRWGTDLQYVVTGDTHTSDGNINPYADGELPYFAVSISFIWVSSKSKA